MKLFKNHISKDTQKLVRLLEEYSIDCILDVGANVGQYAIDVRKGGYKKHIVSIEPLAQNIEHLQSISGKDDAWHIAPQMALGSENTETEINVSEASDMSSVLDIEDITLQALPKGQYVKKEVVPLLRLDSVFDKLMPQGCTKHLLKVDTQGFEQEVLNGATGVLNKIQGIQLELSLFPLYRDEPTFEDITKWVKSQGFEPYLVINGYYSKKIERQLQLDIVFFKS